VSWSQPSKQCPLAAHRLLLLLLLLLLLVSTAMHTIVDNNFSP
jgi:hypothetical protein